MAQMMVPMSEKGKLGGEALLQMTNSVSDEFELMSKHLNRDGSQAAGDAGISLAGVKIET